MFENGRLQEYLGSLSSRGTSPIINRRPTARASNTFFLFFFPDPPPASMNFSHA